MPKAKIYVWTGTGAGKTTSALGVALRAVGHKQKVVVIQFMKGRKDIGEYKVQERLRPYYKVYQFGKRSWVNLKKPSKEDIARANNGLKFAELIIRQKPDLLIMDEINLAIACGLLKIKDVMALLDKANPKTAVYCIGRFAPKELITRADFVNEVRLLKRPKTWKAKKGIEY